MKKITISLLALFLVLSCARSHPEINLVKQGHFPQYPNKIIGEAFNGFFASPSWRYFKDKSGQGIVEFRGKAALKDKAVYNMNLRFSIDKEKKSFELSSFHVGGALQPREGSRWLLPMIFEGR